MQHRWVYQPQYRMWPRRSPTCLSRRDLFGRALSPSWSCSHFPEGPQVLLPVPITCKPPVAWVSHCHGPVLYSVLSCSESAGSGSTSAPLTRRTSTACWHASSSISVSNAKHKVSASALVRGVSVAAANATAAVGHAGSGTSIPASCVGCSRTCGHWAQGCGSCFMRVTVTPAVCPRSFEYPTPLTFGALGRNHNCQQYLRPSQKKRDGSLPTCDQQCIMNCQEHHRS